MWVPVVEPDVAAGHVNDTSFSEAIPACEQGCASSNLRCGRLSQPVFDLSDLDEYSDGHLPQSTTSHSDADESSEHSDGHSPQPVHD
eukprot:4890769-Karenia_brevis.AAC.1